MEKLSQIFLPFISSLIISIAVWASCTVYFLSSGFINGPFGPVINPLSKSLSTGLIIGVLHGIVAGLIICWYKPDSFINSSILSVAATEILLLIAAAVIFTNNYILKPFRLGASPTSSVLQDIFLLVVMFGFWFVFFSLVFSIPSLVIGIANKFVSNFFALLVLK